MAKATTNYGAIARFLHWAIAAMIVLQFVLAELSESAEHDGERLRQLALLANHKSVGMTILVLALVRLGWRFASDVPKLPSAMPSWQQAASKVSHTLLYVLLFALPISGWLMSSASAYSVSWFGLFTWPDLVGPDKDLRDTLKSIHEFIGKALFVIAVIHIVAAFKHHIVDRDGVLKRMAGVGSWLLFAGVIAAGVIGLTQTGGKAKASAAAPLATTTERAPARPDTTETAPASEAESAAPPAEAPPSEAATAEAATTEAGTAETSAAPDAEPEARTPATGTSVAASASPAQTETDADGPSEPMSETQQPQRTVPPAPATLQNAASADASSATGDVGAADAGRTATAAAAPAPPPATPPDWNIDYGDSFIQFTATQAGADFTGTWRTWRADMRFADDALDDSDFDVEVTVSGVETNDDDRDETLMEREWFAADEYPVVNFRTRQFERLADGSYRAASSMTVKGETFPVTLEFRVERDGARRLLTGSATIDRLAMDIGTGEWSDTEWIGQMVQVDVRVAASVSARQ